MASVQENINAVVAADGSGNYKSINDAITAVPANSAERYVVYIKTGIYSEIVKIGSDKPNIKLVGDGLENTRIVGSVGVDKNHKNSGDTAIVSVSAPGFIAQGLSIENTAAQKMKDGWAVALLIDADEAIVYQCALLSHQDTLSAWSGKQFYRECDITGTVDFVYGDATAVFQNCKLLVRRPLSTQYDTITAQGRDSATKNTGFVFQFCTVDAAAGEDMSGVKTYLGRPYHSFSRTIFMQSTISSIVDPDGWKAWDSNSASEDLFYAEYKNTGAGADVQRRVHWKGVHASLDDDEATAFTVANFIGAEWIQSTGVPCTTGLNQSG